MVVLKEIWPTKDTPIWSILPTGQAKYTKKQDKIKKIIRSNKNLREFSAFRGEKFFITKWPTKDAKNIDKRPKTTDHRPLPFLVNFVYFVGEKPYPPWEK